jgi:TMEM175 potassium channel family protein
VSTTRLEAFSDGVIAILITIMVLELRLPHAAGLSALASVWPHLLTYVLSFVYLGIYWNNHHHLLHLTERVNGRILWSNLHLLFWLSLVPSVTGWTAETHFERLPTAAYGVVLLAAALAWLVLQSAIIADQGEGSPLKAALGSDLKGKISAVLYASAIALSFWLPALALAIYALVAMIWLVPDRRIERRLRAG